jgi:hypothetical protein
MPARAGILPYLKTLDTSFRWYDSAWNITLNTKKDEEVL